MYSFMHWFQNYGGGGGNLSLSHSQWFCRVLGFYFGFFDCQGKFPFSLVSGHWCLIAQTQGTDLSWFVLLFAMQMRLAAACFCLYPFSNSNNFANKLTDFAKQQSAKQQSTKQIVTALRSSLSSFLFESDLKQTHKALKVPLYSDRNKPKSGTEQIH